MECGQVVDGGSGGGVDPADGLFYCDVCWEAFSVGAWAGMRGAAGAVPVAQETETFFCESGEDGGFARPDPSPFDRRWEMVVGAGGQEEDGVRVVSYNVLGEHHGMQVMYKYSPSPILPFPLPPSLSPGLSLPPSLLSLSPPLFLPLCPSLSLSVTLSLPPSLHYNPPFITTLPPDSYACMNERNAGHARLL